MTRPEMLEVAVAEAGRRLLAEVLWEERKPGAIELPYRGIEALKVLRECCEDNSRNRVRR